MDSCGAVLQSVHADSGCKTLIIDSSGTSPDSDDLGLGAGGVLSSCVSLRPVDGRITPPEQHSRRTGNRGGVSRIHVVKGGRLIVEGLVFSGNIGTAGVSSWAPVFEIEGGHAVVSHSVFRNYSSTPIRISSGSIACLNCSFISNAAHDGGTQPVEVTSVATAGVGGCIWALGGRVALMKCMFRGNSALMGGGALYITRAEVLVRECTFDSNYCEDDSGGEDGGDARGGLRGGGETEKRMVVDELSGPCGGAILVEYGGVGVGTTNVSLVSSVLRRNRAASGGGMCVRAGHTDGRTREDEGHSEHKSCSRDSEEDASVVDVYDSSFEGNDATYKGGGLAFESASWRHVARGCGARKGSALGLLSVR